MTDATSRTGDPAPTTQHDAASRAALAAVERAAVQRRLEQRNAVLEGITRIFREASSLQTEAELGRLCLAVAEDVTESAFSFLGELDVAGHRLHDLALSERGWAAFPMAVPRFPDCEVPAGFAVPGVYGHVVLDGEGLIVNDPQAHADRIGTPEAPLPLAAFLGVPLVQGRRTIGMIGLGNRPGGYRPEDREAVEALAPAILQVLLTKRAAVALRQSEERLQKAISIETVGVLFFRRDGQILDANAAFERMSGYSRAELRDGMNRNALTAPEHVAQAARTAEELVRHGEAVPYEKQLLRRDGSRWWGLCAPTRIVASGPDGELVEFINDISDRKTAELKLRELAGERETLLRELHHRVKNNLGVIDSLLQLQASSATSEPTRAALHAASHRVHTIAEAHRLLYQAENLAQIDTAAYVRALARALYDATVADPARVTLAITSDAVHLDLLQAVPFGLLLNELLTNALKHGFPDGRAGRVEIALRRQPAAVELVIADDGIGMATDPSTSSLGLKLVRVLAEQLHATLTFETARGTTVRLRLPVDAAPA